MRIVLNITEGIGVREWENTHLQVRIARLQ